MTDAPDSIRPHTAAPRHKVDRDLARVDRMASLLDSRFRIPGTRIRFGWDSLLGLIPGVGDAVTVGPSAWMIYTAWRHGVRLPVIARMGMNTAFDAFVGGIPILGDAFDLVFKANVRNADLLRRELTPLAGEPTRMPKKRSGVFEDAGP